MVTVSYAALCRSLSRERLAGYSLETDQDSADAVARYQWNLALASAMHPLLHLVEIAFRNAIFDAGVEANARRPYRTRVIPCWLDAVPSLLAPREQADVDEAVLRLGNTPRRLTPGHLVSHLGFGFWVRLCNRPYEQGRAAGPQLWPTAAKRFPGCPRHLRTRPDLGRAYSDTRDFRNLIAHHQPIWDRNPVEAYASAVERLSWLNPSLAKAADELARVRAIHDGGPAGFRADSVRIMVI